MADRLETVDTLIEEALKEQRSLLTKVKDLVKMSEGTLSENEWRDIEKIMVEGEGRKEEEN